LLTAAAVLCVPLLTLLTVGCSGRYIGQPSEAVLSYQTDPTYGTLYTLAETYAESINASVAADTLHPGMYADYGVALALMGHDAEACRMMEAEVKAFPQSAGMIARICQRLLPACTIDTSAGKWKAVVVDTALLHTWAYDSLTSLMPFAPIAVVIDSTDTAQIKMQTPVDSVEIPIRLTANQKREMLAEQQAKEAAALQAAQDSVAAAKQAKIDARQQAKLEKEQLKKEKEKAKKAADKAKKKAAKEKAKAKKAAAKEKQRQARENEIAKREAEKAKQKAALEERKAKEAQREKEKQEAALEKQKQREEQKRKQQEERERKQQERQQQQEEQQENQNQNQ